MEPVRFGLSVRALRRKRGWTQAELGSRCGMSQSSISRIEAGQGRRFPVDVLESVVAALGARIRVTVLAHGEDLDRLLDGGHAAIVEHITMILRRRGWEIAPEVTFSIYGERGSIDVLAFHRASGSLLVIEVKSAIPDVQGTLSGIDRKQRLAARVAAERGWRARTVSAWLVVPGDRTTRRRIERHSATFASALPLRTLALRRWSAAPRGAVAGIYHVPFMPEVHARHRASARRR
jgi:transcriptional regulator with XRE-family HTH domain